MFEILGFNSFDATLTIDQKIYLEYVSITKYNIIYKCLKLYNLILFIR